MTSLPIDDFIPEIRAKVLANRAVVVTAAPGAGKTTRVPPALAADGRVLLLQPRRVAARAIARRIASERGWTLGREVGWHVRFDRRDSPNTQLLVATEGILTARLQQDPLLSDFHTVVLDEFHERSIHADLGLALARQAWLARSDLRLVVMSATIDSAKVAAYLRDCPVVDVPGRLFPVDVSYRPGVSVDDAVNDVMPGMTGSVLCFLPGAAEIRRAAEVVERRVGADVRIVPLYGALDADAQDDALTPSPHPRVILATNIAETTLTVPDVRVVIDAGLQKVARYDAERGLDSLETERISEDAADQRAGRAGRVMAGRAIRLWDSRDRLRPHREPDISRIDLTSTLLDIIAWGGDPATLEWFEAPRAEALEHALSLLRSLGAIDAGCHLTGVGHTLHRLPLHPRLGRLMVDAGGTIQAARACAVLSERHFLPPRHGATSCDLLSVVEQGHDLPPHVARVARDVQETAAQLLVAAAARHDEDRFRRAVLAAFPDRVARRRAVGSDRFLLASGTGARLARESGVVSAEFIVAVDVSRGTPRPGAPANEALIRIATGVDRAWLHPSSTLVEHRMDATTGRVRAVALARVGEITIGERDVPADPRERARLLTQALLSRGPSDDEAQWLRRLRFAGCPATFESLVEAACVSAQTFADVDLAAHAAPDVRRRLERDAPASLLLPSGRHARLEYLEDGRVRAAVKLQELFGLADTPRFGRSSTPVTFELLSPAGRPVQVTTDLKSFWTTGYQEVRKELRARYPKHPWPEDPWRAKPALAKSSRAPRRS